MVRIRTIALLTCLGLIGLPATGLAQSPPRDPEEPVAAAALEALAEFPWYDADRGELRRLDVEPPADVKNRDSKWLFTPPNWSLPDWVILLLKVVSWTLLVMLIATIAYLLAKAFMSLDERMAGPAGAGQDLSLGGDVDRVDALPFQLKGPRGDLLAEARRLYEEGRYAEAMIYLYSYQLVRLDRGHVIRLTRGKTNRQYLREVRRRSNLFDIMQHSMVTFEEVFFGNHSLGRGGFEACWSQLDEFHQQLDTDHVLV